MADFRIDVSFFSHTKTKRLKKALGLEGVFALQQLWAYAAANKHDAEKVYSVEDIELAVDWDGEPGSLVSVLATVGFVDEVPSGYVIHEWEAHNGYAATAAKRSEAGRNAAAARWTSKRLCGGNADACEPHCDGNTAAMPTHADSNAPSPFPSPLPSPLPEEENTYAVSDAPKKKSATRTRHKYTPEYEVFYAKFPARHGQKNGKLPGQKAYAKALARPGITPEYLLERITALAPQYGDYPPDIATWLNNERWTDQVATTPPPPASRGRASPADLLEKNVQNMRGWIGHQPGDEHDEQRQTQICSGAFGHGGHL